MCKNAFLIHEFSQISLPWEGDTTPFPCSVASLPRFAPPPYEKRSFVCISCEFYTNTTVCNNLSHEHSKSLLHDDVLITSTPIALIHDMHEALLIQPLYLYTLLPCYISFSHLKSYVQFYVDTFGVMWNLTNKKILGEVKIYIWGITFTYCCLRSPDFACRACWKSLFFLCDPTQKSRCHPFFEKNAITCITTSVTTRPDVPNTGWSYFSSTSGSRTSWFSVCFYYQQAVSYFQNIFFPWESIDNQRRRSWGGGGQSPHQKKIFGGKHIVLPPPNNFDNLKT